MTAPVPETPSAGYDEECRQVLACSASAYPPRLVAEQIPAIRQRGRLWPGLDALVSGRNVRHATVSYESGDGHVVVGDLFLPSEPSAGAFPVILYIHGGGLVAGDRFLGLEEPLSWVTSLAVGVLTVEYRLAPEHPFPMPLEDCCAALGWICESASRHDLDASRVFVAGTSAGGGLAASVAIWARGRRGISLAGQMLMAPMLDDRDQYQSRITYADMGTWDLLSNQTCWHAYLGDYVRQGGDLAHAVPARAERIDGLAPTYIDCGTAELFRDETVVFARRLMESGVDVELHVWSGGFHTFDLVAPLSALAERTRQVRHGWLQRQLGSVPPRYKTEERTEA